MSLRSAVIGSMVSLSSHELGCLDDGFMDHGSRRWDPGRGQSRVRNRFGKSMK